MVMAKLQGEASLREINKAEIFVSYSLRVGVLLSAIVTLTGLISFFVSGVSGYTGNVFPTRVSDIITGAFSLKPFGVIMFGLVLLILTPILRVGVSILIFIIEKDWLYVGISAIVFIILSSSLFFGK